MRKWINLVESEEIKHLGKELASIRKQLSELKNQHDELITDFAAPDFDDRKAAFIDAVSDKWNDLVEREWEIAKQLEKTPSSIYEFLIP